MELEVRGEVLEKNLVIGFSSSVSSFCHTLLGEEIREVVTEKSKLVYREIGKFIFLVHSNYSTGTAILQAILRDVMAMCEFLFGPHEFWNENYNHFNGCTDIFNLYFSLAGTDPRVVVSALSQIAVENEVIDRLDKLLASLESEEGVCGNGTMLIIGDSILHSRFALNSSRLILQLNKARPMDSDVVKYSVVHCMGSWRNLYRIRIQGYVLVVMTEIDKSFSLLQSKMEDFRIAFLQSRLEIPVEEPAVLLRFFTKRETLAMLYHNIKQGYIIFPQLRPGPDVQQNEILETFWWFFGEANASLNIPGVTEYTATRDAYRFHARFEGIHKLYILFATDSVSTDSITSVATEIMKKCIQ